MEHITTDMPITISELTLIPVVRICIHSNNDKYSYGLTGNKEPLAIIVCNENEVHAYDVNTNEIDITLLLQTFPDINADLIPQR